MPSAKPMMAPWPPQIAPPMTMRMPPRPASRTNVLNVFFTAFTVSTVSENWLVAGCVAAHAHRRPRGGASVVVAGVDVHAGHALAVEHVHVATVVLERQAQVEPVAPQVPDRVALERPGGRVVAPLA